MIARKYHRMEMPAAGHSRVQLYKQRVFMQRNAVREILA